MTRPTRGEDGDQRRLVSSVACTHLSRELSRLRPCSRVRLNTEENVARKRDTGTLQDLGPWWWGRFSEDDAVRVPVGGRSTRRGPGVPVGPA